MMTNGLQPGILDYWVLLTDWRNGSFAILLALGVLLVGHALAPAKRARAPAPWKGPMTLGSTATSAIEPVNVSRGGCSFQFGRASAPKIPHLVHTILGPKVGTRTWSAQASTLKIARWWHCQQDTSSERTPFSRMLPRVIGSIGLLMRATRRS